MARRNNRGRNRGTGSSARGLYATAGRVADAQPTSAPIRRGHWTTAPRTPDGISASLVRSGMDAVAPMGPGRPLNPYQGYSNPPRATDYPTNVNISTRTRSSWGLPSYETIRAIIKAYDIARICVNHKVDELRSMEPMFLPADGVRGDVSAAIDAARAALAFPDRELPFDAWFAKWLENLVKFDSGPLYRRRNFDGDIIGLEVLDGTSIMPYIDERGRRPTAPDPAYFQLIHGQVWNWYTHQDIIYCAFRPQEDSPFGTAPMESILLTANTDIRFQWHFLQMFTEGSIPGGFVELPPDISSPDQVAEWQDYWDAMVMGDQAKLHQLIAVPNGTKITNARPDAFDSAFPEYLMARTCAAHGIVPQDIGLVKDVNRANGETQVDIQFRVNTLPWVNYVQGVLTRYLQYDLRLPVQVKLNTGRDKQDRLQEAQAWKIGVDAAAVSSDEMRSELYGLPVDKDRPTPRAYANARLGPIPVASLEAVAGRTDPETYGPAADQPPLDRPYAGVIGVIPQAGTADAEASRAAVDAEQQTHRAELNAELDTGRGASPANVPSVADPDVATIGKTASRDLVADELAAFRRYATTRAARGRWRDFDFTVVDPASAAALNAAERARIGKAADQIPAASPAADDTAQAVYDQLRENFPPDQIAWVLDMGWTGPKYVPLDQVNFDNAEEWAAAHDPKRVDRFRRKIKRGTLHKPVILVRRPGRNVDVIVDGHHRGLAARAEGQPILAYVGHADAATGPWDELHSFQDSDGDGKPDNPGKKRGKVAKDTAAAAAPAGPTVAGLAVRAADTGRVLMLQRGLEAGDPAAGCWEFPGGHLEPGEPPLAAAIREWSEETGCGLPGGRQTGTWASRTGVYTGFVWTVSCEDAVPVFGDRDAAVNPDDPGGDRIEALAWWEPAQLPGNPAVREELNRDLKAVFDALGVEYACQGDTGTCPCGTPVQFDAGNGWHHADGSYGHDDGESVAEKMGLPVVAMKTARRRTVRDWAGWERDRELATHYSGRIRSSLTAAVDAEQLARRWLGRRVRKAAADPNDPAWRAAADWLIAAGYLTAIEGALTEPLTGAYTEGWALGTAAAIGASTRTAVDWAGWTPGDPDAANLVLGPGGAGAGLAQMLDDAGIRITSLGNGRLDDLARALALSLERGDSSDTLARDLRDILDDARWADMTATTEIARAVSAASLQTYTANGIEYSEWASADDGRVCPYCEENEDAGPVRIGDAFPSGDVAPPGHPRCRCAPMPYLGPPPEEGP